MAPSDPEQHVRELLHEGNLFTFDSERGSSESELCRKDERTGRLQCVKVPLASMRLFALMGKEGFFCLAPAGDPTKTEIECRRLAEKPLDKL